ncbi:MAG: hypothetical protein ACXVRW_18265, partial [Solirubrobacteraceae bacterium]
MDELREACATVAARARCVTVRTDAIAPSAAVRPRHAAPAPAPPPATPAEREARAAHWLTMDAI